MRQLCKPFLMLWRSSRSGACHLARHERVAALPWLVRRCRRRRSGAARYLEPNGKRRLEDRYSRHWLELTRRLGRSHFPDHRRQHRATGATEARLLSRRLARVDGAPPLAGVRRRFHDGQDSLGAGSQQQHSTWASKAPQKQLRLGDACHRWRARCTSISGTPASSRSISQAVRCGRRKIGPFKTRNNWGAAGSPVLHGDRVYVLNDNDDQSFLAAFDKRTGAEIWRVNRAEGTNWSTPFVWENEQRTEIVTSGSDRVRSYDLAGKLLWELSGMSTISIPTPFARHGLLYISSGYVGDALRPAYAIRPGASGDISLKGDETTNAHIVWSSRTGAPYNPTPNRLRRLLLHALRQRVLHEPRCEDRQGDLQPAAHHRRCERLYCLALGLQRQDFRDERGRGYVRHPGRHRIQSPRKEFAQRDDAGDAGRRTWQSHRSNRVETVSVHEVNR